MADCIEFKGEKRRFNILKNFPGRVEQNRGYVNGPNFQRQVTSSSRFNHLKLGANKPILDVRWCIKTSLKG